MALFKRKKLGSKAVPPEVKQYYASEHRERVGLAWLIAFLSLIVTVVVVAGLFFGGRWAYRKIAHNDNKSTTATTADNKPNSQSSPEPSNKSSNQQPENNNGENSANSGDTSNSSNSSSSSSSGSNSSSDSSNSSSSDSSSSSSGNSTGSESEDITDTGPGNMLAIFVAVTILATVAHRQYQKRKILADS